MDDVDGLVHQPALEKESVSMSQVQLHDSVDEQQGDDLWARPPQLKAKAALKSKRRLHSWRQSERR